MVSGHKDQPSRASGRRVLPRIVLGFGVAVFLSACDPGALMEPPPPAVCSAIGDRCQRSDGPVGVCQTRPCPPGVEGLCYVCTPQH
jgi:hypothetical protein